jgi:hypothetical protein
MRIRFIKHWRRGIKMGEVRDLPDGMANLLIKRKLAVTFTEPVIPAERQSDEDSISEGPCTVQVGGNGGSSRKRGKQAAVAGGR